MMRMRRLAPIAAGIVLLAAGSLKARELGLAAGPNVAHGRWAWSVLAGLELALGYCLVVAIYPAFSARVARFAFVVFALVTLYRAVTGEATCACFGAAKIHPWATFGLDLAMIVALTAWRRDPPGEREPAPASTALRRVPIALIPLILAFIPSAVALASTATRPPVVTIELNPVAVGAIRPGGSTSFRLAVLNPRPVAESISSIEASCPCVQMTSSLPCWIKPMGETFLQFSVDLAKESAFRGDLAILVRGLDPSGDELFRAEVRMSVVETLEFRNP
jgi:hypothetical protein